MADNFTDMAIKNLAPAEKEYTRREKGGFGIRVFPSGRKVFFYMYRVDGQRKFLNLGDYPATSLKDARAEYELARGNVKALKAGRAEGVDPVELRKDKRAVREERRKAHSITDLVKEYIEKHAMKFKRSWADDKRLLDKEIIPIWGNSKAADIKKRDVTLVLESIVERGSPAMSNQTLKIVRKMFNFAVERDILQFNPCLGVKSLAPDTARERVLNETEIRTFWSRLDIACMTDELRRALKLILVTAQRPNEVIGMHTVEIDGQWWTIPSERSKNGTANRVYLTKTALDLIGDLTVTDEDGEIKPKGYIFPTPHLKKSKSIDAHALAVATRRNLAWPVTDAKGKPLFDKNGKPATENKLEIDQFTPHDLRRTAATFMASMKFMDEVIDAVLNHKKQGIIKVYNQYRYDTEKQQALEAWERKLDSIINGKKDNVIPICKIRA